MKKAPYSQSIDIDEGIKTYLPLVKRIAFHIGSRLPPNVEVDDLIQEGLTGLLDALKRYEPQPGLEFEAYARTRIRGAIYDACRKNDVLPRNQRDELDTIEKTTLRLQQKLGRNPSDLEIASAASLSINEYYEIIGQMVHLMPIDDLSDDLLPSESNGYDPLQSAATSQFVEQMALILKTLPENEKMIMALHYQEDLSYREIAQVLNLTAGRISQLHTQAIIRIRAKLNKPLNTRG